MAKKRLTLRDKQGNVIDYDISAARVTIDAEGKTLDVKLSELVNAIAATTMRVVFNGNTHNVNGGTINLGNQLQPDWAETSTTYPSFIKNKPDVVTGIKVGASGSTITPTNGVVTIPESGGGSVDVDNAMSASSDNPVANRVIKAYVDGLINGLINGAPAALDTLNELSAALGNDSNFAATITNALANKVDKVTGKGLSTNDYTTEEKTKLAGLPTNPVTSISVNGTAQQKDQNGNVNLVVETGGLTEADIDVSSNQDGTVDFTFGEDTYSINLNHTHENMAKLVTDDVEDLPNPAEMENDTIYAGVENGEISVIYINGYPFYGGGNADTGEPQIDTPSNGANIDMGTDSGSGFSKQIRVKARNITQPLTVAISDTGYAISYGQSTGQSSIQIPAAQALLGADITITCTTTSSVLQGTLVISSSELSSPTSVNLTAFPVVELEAVKFTKQQYVITDIYPGANTRLEIDMKFSGTQATIDTNTQTRNFIQCNKGSGTKVFSFNTNTTQYPKRISYYVEDVTSGDTNLNMTYNAALNSARSTMIWDNSTKKVTFLGQDFTVLQKTSTMPNPMYIGGQMSENKVFGEFDIILYGVKHYENNVLMHNYVPQTRGGVAGLYDTVNDTFISSETSVELVAIELTT